MVDGLSVRSTRSISPAAHASKIDSVAPRATSRLTISFCRWYTAVRIALSPLRLRASMRAGSADTIAFTRSNSPALIASMKAALLDVASGMHRYYPGLAFVCVLACASAAGAQTSAAQREQMPLLGVGLSLDELRDLPVANSPFQLLETIPP